MSRRVRWVLFVLGVLCVAAFATVGIVAGVQSSRATAGARVQAPLAIGTELQRPRSVPHIPLVDAAGVRTSLAAWRGRWVVLAPSMTLCHEVCPITTGALIQLTNKIRRAGLSDRVVVVEATVDPWRDSPARLRAYRHLAGVNFPMLTGTRSEIRRLWRFFGVAYHRVAEGHPADIDWMTHKPEAFDIDHTDGLFFISPSGQERIVNEGMASVHGRLSPALRKLLSTEGDHNLEHPQLPWTAGQALEDIDFLMDRTIPAREAQSASAPSLAAAHKLLARSPRLLDGIHAQAGQLLGSAPALMARLRSLRGRYPVVLNIWASWCPGCREEFPLFAAASAHFGKSVAFLGVDTNDSAASNARRFLADHHVSYPSYRAQSTQLSSLAAIQGFPTTIYINRNGKISDVHLAQYQTAADLDNDIAHYSLHTKG